MKSKQFWHHLKCVLSPLCPGVIIVRSGPLTLKEKFFRSIIQLYKVDWTKVERERKRD